MRQTDLGAGCAGLVGFGFCLLLACGIFNAFSGLGWDGGTNAGYRWAFLIVGAGFVGCFALIHLADKP